jgi:hypothetical protein
MRRVLFVQIVVQKPEPSEPDNDSCSSFAKKKRRFFKHIFYVEHHGLGE